MTMNWKRAVVGTAAVAVIGVGSIAALSAQGPGPRGRGGMHAGPWGGFGPLMQLRHGLQALGVTDAQREQIKAVVQQHRDEFKVLAERGQAARQGLREAVTADAPDEAAIREKSLAVAGVHADAAVLAARVRGEVFAILTPEQQAKAKELRANAEKHRMQRRGRVRQWIGERIKGGV